MLELAEKLTRSPWTVGERDRESLRTAGLSEQEVLHVVLGCSVFNYLNRMADGLGIECEYKTELPKFQVPEGARSATTPETMPSYLSAAPRVEMSSLVATSPDAPRGIFEAMAESADARDRAKAWRRYQLEATQDLGGRVRARIGLHVSLLNRCDYGAWWFERQLLKEGGALASPSPREELLLAHVERLTREPWTAREVHIEALRSAGLDDTAILQLTMLASYVNFENRVALGLGVRLEAAA